MVTVQESTELAVSHLPSIQAVTYFGEEGGACSYYSLTLMHAFIPPRAVHYFSTHVSVVQQS